MGRLWGLCPRTRALSALKQSGSGWRRQGSSVWISKTCPTLTAITYTIKVWANPAELTPSANPPVPAEPIERSCSVEVDVIAGKR